MTKGAGTDRPKSPKRVQGVESDIDDLILRSSGRPLTIELGARITEDPTLTRTIEGASSITLDVFDPEMQVLRKSLLAERWDCEVDGLGFRYTGLAKSEETLTLTLEDEWVAMLKEKKGPIRVKRENSTRAEFIKRLVEEACPGLDFYCPQLHVKQPIGTNAEKHEDRKKLKEEAAELQTESEENRGPGLGANVGGLKVKGEKPTPAQVELGELALHIANSVSAPYICQVALIAALIDETDMGAVDPQNVLQAEQEITGEGGEGAKVRPAAEEIKGFLTNEPAWTGQGAIAFHKANPSANAAEIAAGIQGNANGASDYARFVTEAQEWVSVFWGESGGISKSESKTVVEPYRFEVHGGEKGKRRGAPENYWEAIRRLAKEVNWRVFIVADRMYFMPETELIESAVRLVIDPDTPNIENVDFEYHVGGEVTEVTVTALIGEWKAPPGSVVTVTGYGPASLATPENRKAEATKGPGRYLVSSIEIPMSDQPAKRMATITLKTPTRPLAEPEAKTKSVSIGSKKGSSPLAPPGAPPEIGMLLAAMEEIGDTVYSWAGGHSPPFVKGGEEENGGPGYDCSGAMSLALHRAGLLDSPETSGELAERYEPGKGEWFVIYANAEHVWCEIKTNQGWKEWEEGGTNGDHAGFLASGTQSPAGYSARHPRGL